MPRKNPSTADEIIARLGIKERQRQALARAAETLRTQWVEELSQPGSGKVFETRFITTAEDPRMVVPIGKRAPHQASAAGEPPAPDTGETARSIAAVPYDDGDTYRVGTNRRSLLALEFGINVEGSEVEEHPAVNFEVAPRPSARPAETKAEPDMKKAFLEVMRGK